MRFYRAFCSADSRVRSNVRAGRHYVAVDACHAHIHSVRGNHAGGIGFNIRRRIADRPSYTLVLKKYRTNLDSYTLKAEVSGASGADSQGEMILKKNEN